MNGAVHLAYPFSGRWLVQNSPADRVPSHGTDLFGTSHAIDFVPLDASGRHMRPASVILARSADPARRDQHAASGCDRRPRTEGSPP